MPREKVTPEEKAMAAKDCAEGRISQTEAARRLGVDESTVSEWVQRYKANGASAFRIREHNAVYSEELKRKAVEEYLAGAGSLRGIAAKYGLRSNKQLRVWIKQYNSGKDFGRKMSGGSHMKQGRETTKEERLKIVKDCLASGKNYGDMALKYKVSYQQVRTWTLRFEELGESGLEDRRGKRKKDQTPRTELEAAQIEIERLKHQLYLAEMERDLLKKLDEIERRDVSHK